MGRRVKQGIFGTVYVTDDEGARHTFVAGDEVPEWAAAKLVDVLDDGTEKAADPDDTVDSGGGLGNGGVDGADAPEPPPHAGPGSGVEAWRAYATSIGVQFDDDATRAEIIAAVEAGS